MSIFLIIFYKCKQWSIVNGQEKSDKFARKIMLVGEISKKTGLSRDTIRFYEKKGLIKVERSKSDWNNYKNYDEIALNKLFMIKKAKGFGFTLNEISEILELFEMDLASCNTMATKVTKKLNEIDEKIKALENMRKMIFDKIMDAQKSCDTTVESNNCQSFLEKT